MRGVKNFFGFIKDPPVWFIAAWLVLTLAAIGGSIAAVALAEGAAWASAVYAAAAVTLAYSVYLTVKCAPKIKQSAVKALEKRQFSAALLHDFGFRTLAFAVVASIINAAYVAVNGASAIIYGSVWYASMTAYYLALALLRGGVLYADRRVKRQLADGGPERAKHKIYLGCGIALLVLEFALIAAVTQLVMDEEHARTGLIFAISTAAYSFYKLIIAIVNMVRARRYSDPAVQCFRNINLVDALVSLLSLEVTMIATQGGSMPVMTAVSGAAVSAFNMILGVIMIVQAARALKREK